MASRYVSRKVKLVRKLAAVFVLLVVALMIYWLFLREQPGEKLSDKEYSYIKSLLRMPGTEIWTVKLQSRDKRTACGTMVISGDYRVIVTVAHLFASENGEEGIYWYVLGEEVGYISSVKSHPKTSPLEEVDIAYCFIGERKALPNYSKLKKVDYGPATVHAELIPHEQFFHLEERVNVEVVGTLTNPVSKQVHYLSGCDSRDGMSGSGFLKDGELYVLVAGTPADKLGSLVVYASKYNGRLAMLRKQ